jgi:hypothetical protein
MTAISARVSAQALIMVQGSTTVLIELSHLVVYKALTHHIRSQEVHKCKELTAGLCCPQPH